MISILFKILKYASTLNWCKKLQKNAQRLLAVCQFVKIDFFHRVMKQNLSCKCNNFVRNKIPFAPIGILLLLCRVLKKYLMINIAQHATRTFL